MMSVRRAFVWAIAGQIVSFAVSFGTTVILSRLLSPREIGIYAVSMAVTSILQAVSSFGISAYIVGEKNLDENKLAAAVTVNAIASLLLGVGIVIASFIHSVTLGEPLVGATLRILALVPLLSIIEFQPFVMLQRTMQFDHVSRITVLRTLAGSVTSVIAALLGAGALSSAYGAIVFAVFGAIAFPLVGREYRTVRPSLVQWRIIATFGLRSLSIGGVALIAMRLSEILLGHFLGLAALGVYSRASAISSILFQNLYGTITRVLMAQMADEVRRGHGLQTIYLRGLAMVLGVMWPLLGGIGVLAAPLVVLLFGPQWDAAAMPLAILMLGQAIVLSFGMSYELFVLRDRIAQQVPLEFVRSLVGLCGFVVGCYFGLNGAAAGRVLDSTIGALLILPWIKRLAGVEWHALNVVYGRSVALTVSAVAPSVALMMLWNWRADVPFGWLALSVAAGAAIWLAMLRLQQHALYDEGVLIVRRLMRRME